jgi:hypothetical protein
LKEQAKLLEEKDQMDQEIATQRAANTAALKPDVPYTRSGQYNRTVNRLKQLQQLPGMPTIDAPGATADQAGGHADDYGQKVSDADVEAMQWAKAHPDDPRSAAILRKLGIQ